MKEKTRVSDIQDWRLRIKARIDWGFSRACAIIRRRIDNNWRSQLRLGFSLVCISVSLSWCNSNLKSVNMGESEVLDNGRIELKRELGCVVNEEAELGASPRRKHARLASETTIDALWSELRDNPVVSPTRDNENVSSLDTSSSHPAEMVSSSDNQVNSGDITSESSGNSCLVSCIDERSRNHGSCSGVSTSQISLEIPKHISTTGIRKITFKFSKSKEEYESKLSSSAAAAQLASSGVCEADSIIDSSDELGLDDSSDRFLYNMELKMSKKVVPDSYPTNVKKLLATGILEGARVKYISTSGEVGCLPL